MSASRMPYTVSAQPTSQRRRWAVFSSLLARALHLAGRGLRGLRAIDLALEREAEARVVEVVGDVLVGVHRDVDRHLELMIVPPHHDPVAAQRGVVHALERRRNLVDVHRARSLDGEGEHVDARVDAGLVDVPLVVQLLYAVMY